MKTYQPTRRDKIMRPVANFLINGLMSDGYCRVLNDIIQAGLSTRRPRAWSSPLGPYDWERQDRVDRAFEASGIDRG